MEKKCACQGIRTCLACEDNEGEDAANGSTSVDQYVYCDCCHKAWANGMHQGASFDFPGIFVSKEFVTANEEVQLIDEIDQTQWTDSQSGRRKQDYGPKVNFKKKKIKSDVFTGLPAFSKFLYERLQGLNLLEDFKPVELCNLDYHPSRGSAIDPHFDDFWLWGERLVTLNLLSETILTFTKDCDTNKEVAIPLPQRSLLVVFGPARHKWKHSIHRKDINSRRIAMTWREATPEFLIGQSKDIGEKLIKTALTFQGVAVGTTFLNQSG